MVASYCHQLEALQLHSQGTPGQTTASDTTQSTGHHVRWTLPVELKSCVDL